MTYEQKVKQYISYEQKQWFSGFYSFTDFALATGLKAPIVSQAYNDFRDFTIKLQQTEGNGYYEYDGIISEAFERWLKTQKEYQID